MTALAVSLARPVARGLLPIEQAEAALAMAILKAERDGTQEGYADFDDRFRFDCHLLQLRLDHEWNQLAQTRHAIAAVLAPMIRKHRPWNHLMAEAHSVNGQNGFALTEAAVAELVEERVWLSLPRAPKPSFRRRPRYG